MRFDPKEGYTGPEIKSPVQAIKQFCLECAGDSALEVRHCTGKKCTLFPFRTGKNPYIKRNPNPENAKRLREYCEKMRAKSERSGIP